MDRYHLYWLLRFGEGAAYKVGIPINDPWILKEGEIVGNESYRSK